MSLIDLLRLIRWGTARSMEALDRYETEWYVATRTERGSIELRLTTNNRLFAFPGMFELVEWYVEELVVAGYGG